MYLGLDMYIHLHAKSYKYHQQLLPIMIVNPA